MTVFWMSYSSRIALTMGPRPLVVQDAHETNVGVDAHSNDLGVRLGGVRGDNLLGAAGNDSLSAPPNLIGVAVADGVTLVLLDHAVLEVA